MARQRKLAQAGLTFVELLLVLFVLVAAGTGTLGAYFSTHLLSQFSRETMVATEDLKDMVERISATPFANLLTNFPAGDVDGPVANNYATIVGGYTLPAQAITVTYPAPQTATRLEVLVTLTWTSSGRARTQALATVKTSS